jgi:hypothetical protein
VETQVCVGGGDTETCWPRCSVAVTYVAGGPLMSRFLIGSQEAWGMWPDPALASALHNTGRGTAFVCSYFVCPIT